MGRGDDELGHKLMKAFIFAVTQQEELPATMLFSTTAVPSSPSRAPGTDDLKGLAEQGVEILTCGTCWTTLALKTSLRWARSPTCTHRGEDGAGRARCAPVAYWLELP